MEYFKEHFVAKFAEIMKVDGLFHSILIWTSAAASYFDHNGQHHTMTMTGDPPTIYQSHEIDSGVASSLGTCVRMTSVDFNQASGKFNVRINDVSQCSKSLLLSNTFPRSYSYTFDSKSVSLMLGLSYQYLPDSLVDTNGLISTFQFTAKNAEVLEFGVFTKVPSERYAGSDEFYCIYQLFSTNSDSSDSISVDDDYKLNGNFSQTSAAHHQFKISENPRICFFLYFDGYNIAQIGVPLIYSLSESLISPDIRSGKGVYETCHCPFQPSSTFNTRYCNSLTSIFGILLFNIGDRLVSSNDYFYSTFFAQYFEQSLVMNKTMIELIRDDAKDVIVTMSTLRGPNTTYFDDDNPHTPNADSFAFCGEQCAVVAFYTYESNSRYLSNGPNVTILSSMSANSYTVRNQICTDTMTLSPNAWSAIASNPPVQLTERFYQCQASTFLVLFNSIGIAGGAIAPIPLLFGTVLIPLMLLILLNCFSFDRKRVQVNPIKKHHNVHATLKAFGASLSELRQDGRIDAAIEGMDDKKAIEVLKLLLKSVITTEDDTCKSDDAVIVPSKSQQSAFTSEDEAL